MLSVFFFAAAAATASDHAARDLDRRTILSRQVNGKPFAPQFPLSVNGKAVELR